MTAPLRLLHIDFETFYDTKDGYSLKAMPTLAYVRDRRFKALGCSVAWDDEPARWTPADELEGLFASVDWASTAVSAYNCQFDACVLTQRYGARPARYVCPLSAARALLPDRPHSLASVARLLGAGAKGSALVDGAAEASEGLADYANNDNELARRVYKALYPLLTGMERDLIDVVVRTAVEPRLLLDAEELRRLADGAEAARAALIARSGLPEAELVSNVKFAAALRGLGVEPPVKVSKATGEETAAFAKGDAEFVGLMASRPDLAPLWEGRLAAKSNINVARPRKLLALVETSLAGGFDNSVGMPRLYHGAHTGRESGCDGLNVQNLPGLRVSGLRGAFMAPPGHRLVVVDSAQVELRVALWLCGQEDRLGVLRRGGDLYREEAASQFGVPLDAVTKDQRQFGKVVSLGCVFGMGAGRFRDYCASGPLGMAPMALSDADAAAAIARYRGGSPMVVEAWRRLDGLLRVMAAPGGAGSFGAERHNDGAGVVSAADGALWLPSGRPVQYPGLRVERWDDEAGRPRQGWAYGLSARRWLWGGTLLENVVQAVARDVVMWQMLAIGRRWPVVSATHDEVLFVAPEDEADGALAFGLEAMSEAPPWAPGLPLSAEGGHGARYSK